MSSPSQRAAPFRGHAPWVSTPCRSNAGAAAARAAPDCGRLAEPNVTTAVAVAVPMQDPRLRSCRGPPIRFSSVPVECIRQRFQQPQALIRPPTAQIPGSAYRPLQPPTSWLSAALEARIGLKAEQAAVAPVASRVPALAQPLFLAVPDNPAVRLMAAAAAAAPD